MYEITYQVYFYLRTTSSAFVPAESNYYCLDKDDGNGRIIPVTLKSHHCLFLLRTQLSALPR